MRRCTSSAGWTADVERWQSDRDSDNSADEVDQDEQAGTLSEATTLAADGVKQ